MNTHSSQFAHFNNEDESAGAKAPGGDVARGGSGEKTVAEGAYGAAADSMGCGGSGVKEMDEGKYEAAADSMGGGGSGVKTVGEGRGEVVRVLLRKAAKKTRGAAMGFSSLRGMAVWLGVVVAATAVDAAFGLSMRGLVALDAVILCAAVIGVLDLVSRLWRHRFHERRVARGLEGVLGVGDSSLINTVALSAGGAGIEGWGMSEVLRARAVQSGDAAASGLRPMSLFNMQQVKRAALALVLVLAILGGWYVSMPRVFEAVWPRLLAPNAGHPPYTPLEFEVTVNPDRVLYSQRVEIHARISGPNVPEQANVVFGDGEEEQVAAMMQGSEPAYSAGAAGVAEHADRSFVFAIDRAGESRTFYIDTPGGRSRSYELVVHPVPLFKQVEVEYEYPAYTGWAGYQSPVNPTRLKALAGTRLHITVHSTLPLDHAKFAVQPREGANEGDAGSSDGTPIEVRLEPDAADPTVARGVWQMDRSGDFALRLTGADQTPGMEEETGKVECIKDLTPSITIDDPIERVVVPEGWPVEVKVSMSDDIKVARSVMLRSVSHWGPYGADLVLDQQDARHATATYRFDLAKLGARAGDIISYFATAYDNYPEIAHESSTGTHVIQVISLAEFKEYARTQYKIDDILKEYRDIMERMSDLATERERLKKELEELKQQSADGSLTDAEREKMKKLEEDLEAYGQVSKDLAEELEARSQQETVYDFEQQYQALLHELAEGLEQQDVLAEQVEESSKNQRESPTQENKEKLNQSIDAFSQYDKPFDAEQQEAAQQVQKDLEKLQKLNAMQAAVEKLGAVADKQRELADRMAQYRNHETLSAAEQIQMSQMAAEQAGLQQELHDAMEELDEAAEAAKEELPNMSGAAKRLTEAIRDMKIEENQSDAERFGNEGDGKNAWLSAVIAAEKLETLKEDAASSMGNEAAMSDMDGCLALPNNDLKEALRQMQAGRCPKPGQGEGEGAGGYKGSNARVRVQGPGMDSEGDSRVAGGGDTAKNESNKSAGEAERGEGPEVLSMENSEQKLRTGVALPGVPAPYRDDAEAYFRRLAEEANRAVQENDRSEGEQP